jgi:RHS repeat-associated protein
VLSLPKGGGAIRGIGEKFSTNLTTGTGSLSVPIATSPGRAGFELGLTLGYDSGAGNGPFGIGWHLSTPSVTRKTDKGLPRYVEGEDPDVFVLSGAEDLVPVRVRSGSGTRLDVIEQGGYRVQRYRPRTEGLFARIEQWTDKATGEVHWRATTRDNVLNIYGRSPLARIADPEHPGRVFSWLLEETRDDRGNLARYTYKAEDGTGVDAGQASESNRFEAGAHGSRLFRATAQRYLKRIQYGNRVPVMDRGEPAPGGDEDYLFEVVFDYGEHHEAAQAPAEERPWPVRQDAFSSYRATFEVRTYRLCRRVLMFHRFAELGPTPCLVRSTDFTYEEGPVVTYLVAVTHAGYQRAPGGGTYERATHPPLELGYAKPMLRDELRTVDSGSLVGIPGGVPGGGAQWVDLDGEGIPGVLVPDERAWLYKANLGHGHLAPPARLRSLPMPAELSGGVQRLMDLDGDGQLDLVQYAPPLSGYFERTAEGDWAPFMALRGLPGINWNDPHLRFLDIDGDGHADVLITEHEAFVWYRSRAKEGFEPAISVPKPQDERKGPAVVFADGTETILLADMSGDGMMDIVRVRNGQVCYWPNLGYGRFGRRVTLDNSPVFDAPERFDPKRIRFADIDGSGTSDIVYLGRDGVRLYFNQSGNALSAPTRLQSLPPVDSLSSLSVVDLLGQGTACLVWSSPLPGNAPRPLAYVDLMGGKKPHVLESVVNNLGAETRIAYAPSTKFYLEDKAAGKPWLTRLAFPVHVIERIERYDHVARTKLVTRFRYRHGYFDGHEREFRGFACVEQWDAESFSGDEGKGLFPGDEALDLPPVRTVTWFHTGAWLERERLELALAREYYDKDPQAPLLPDTTLPAGLSVREEREAARALRGQMLRQEVYAEDGTPEAIHPYTVSERDYEVRLLQQAGDKEKAHAVFFVHPRHTLNLHYERKPSDPRMQHEVVLDVDDFGNVTRSAAIGYPRRTPAEPEQARLWATVTQHTFANRPHESGWYRVGVPVETLVSELTGLAAPALGILSADEVRAKAASVPEVPYEVPAMGGGQRRVIERDRQLYYRDDLSGPLPLGQVESRALAFETYRQVFTPGLLANAYGTRVTDAILQGEGRYVRQDGVWWAPSGRAIFDPTRFYLPIETIDPFGQHHRVRYDAYALLALEAEDPLQNRTTVGLRDAAGTITQNGNDYRVLAPALLTDPNRNREAVEFDALGRVVKTAVMGKEGAGEGDTLADPTTRLEYSFDRWRSHKKPDFVHTLAREKHGAANPRWQESYSYSDGSGREVMTKVQAEPGPVPVLDSRGRPRRNPDGSMQTRQERNRWVGTGRTVFDNKGHPVKKYEPFFSGTSEYEDEKELAEWGVTLILRHDPLGRLVRTDRPNGTHALVVFDAWRQETWDENDTVVGTPWLARKQVGTPAERRCASLALAHAGTPTAAHLDSLGRVFLTVADNGPGGLRPTRVELDIEGNQRSVTDARGNLILRQVFDMMSRPVRVVRADAGPWDATLQRRAVPVATDPDGARTLLDVADKPIRRWDERGHAVRSLYDELQRPTHLFVREEAGAEKLVERTVYGETHAAAETRNLRSRAYQTYDGAGALTNAWFDFKGNLRELTRRLAREYRDGPDWSPLGGLTSASAVEAAAASLLEAEGFTSTRVHDALNRVTSQTTPDGSETRSTYNEASLLEKVEARIRGAATWTTFVAGIDYNARGQRERVEYGSGTVTGYTYDEETFRLVELRTTRTADHTTLQELRYECDPVGNIVAVADAVSYGNAAEPAHGLYEYDALYQLVRAEGREHPGQQPAEDDPPLLRIEHPNDVLALRRYRESYVYDLVGNIERMIHQPLAAGDAGWTRRYVYAPDSNRLLRTSVPGDAPGTLSAAYEHDDAGNMVRMPHLPELRWDHEDRLRSVKKQVQNGPGPANEIYFAYDSSGQRVRKVYAHGGFIEERVYIGDYEVYRKRAAGAAQPDLERQTLHVMDDRRRVALVETKTVDMSVPGSVATTRQRFQLDNHLGSSAMELDEVGAVITYEEYHSYGTTSFHAARSAVEVSAKRYRYTGKERDEETGLSYHGARYYAPWLGRWTACDPAGLVDGTNLFAYVRGQPLNLVDNSGRNAAAVADFGRQLAIGGGAASAALLADDVTVIGVVDDVLIPVALVGAAVGLLLWGGATLLKGPNPAPPRAPPAPPRAPPAPPQAPPRAPPRPGNPPARGPTRAPTESTTPRPGPTQRPAPDPRPRPPVDPLPPGLPEERRRPGLFVWVTYTNEHPTTGKVYSGRTSTRVREGELPVQAARRAVRERWAGSKHADRLQEGYRREDAQLDQFTIQQGPVADRSSAAYAAIRGREQYLIDFHGGAQLDVRNGVAGTSGNPSRGIRRDHPRRQEYMGAAGSLALPDRHPGGPLPNWP